MPELQHSWTNYSSAVARLGPLRHLCPYAVCIKVLGKFHSWITQVLVTGIHSSEWVTGHKISLTGVKDICVQCWSFSLREIAAPDFLFARQCPSSNTSPGDHDASKVWKRVPSRPYFQVVGLEPMFPSAGEDQPMIQPEESCSVLEAAEGGCSLDSMQNDLLNPGKSKLLCQFRAIKLALSCHTSQQVQQTPWYWDSWPHNNWMLLTYQEITRDLGMADIADKASGVWTNVSWVTGGNQDSKAMKHPVFKAPISFRKR